MNANMAIGPRFSRSVFDSASFGIGPGPDDLSVAASGYGHDDYYCCDTGVDPATLAALLAGNDLPTAPAQAMKTKDHERLANGDQPNSS